MLKSRTGNEKSVQMVTWAICGSCDTFVIVNRVVSPAAFARSTSKYGSSNVAAGATLMSQLSSLFVVAGAPVGNVAFGAIAPALRAYAEPATARMAIRAQTKAFLISISYTSQ